MKAFMGNDFLLSSETAQKLYDNYAKPLPIIDYHCHINPKEIAENRQFENITQLWLGGDHYKWRQMRSNGVEERYITGDAPDREKFQKWAETLEKAVGNPLYHWSHLELKQYFGYEGHLCGSTAEEVWQLCNQKLTQPDMAVRGIIAQSNVSMICTTDDPIDDLQWHKAIAEDTTFETKVLPAWRPDKAMNLEKADYLAYLASLEKASGVAITSFSALLQALENRLDFFAAMGCTISDHGLEELLYCPSTEAQVDAIFADRLQGKPVGKQAQAQFKTAFLVAMGKAYHKRGWVMQVHFGCKRDNNRANFEKMGPDTGFDCILSGGTSAGMADFLNALACQDSLPKTILYSLDPNLNAAIDSVIGCFQNSEAIGKIQHGSAWWFNDHKEGMISQMISLANLGLLGNFVGMLTDSRSFLSYTRHEYFRRILCELIGGFVENGEYPNDEQLLQNLITDISFANANRYFAFDLQK